MRFVVDRVAVVQAFQRLPGFAQSVLFRQCSILFFNYMLLLQEGQTGEGGEPSIKECSFGNREALGRQVFSLFSSLKD